MDRSALCRPHDYDELSLSGFHSDVKEEVADVELQAEQGCLIDYKSSRTGFLPVRSLGCGEAIHLIDHRGLNGVGLNYLRANLLSTGRSTFPLNALLRPCPRWVTSAKPVDPVLRERGQWGSIGRSPGHLSKLRP
jgi:hypothetical protein